eukprot:8408631-Pyramimonas_sp.AAC.1
MLEGARNMCGVENYPGSMAFQAAICIVDDPQSESSYAVDEIAQEVQQGRVQRSMEDSTREVYD